MVGGCWNQSDSQDPVLREHLKLVVFWSDWTCIPCGPYSGDICCLCRNFFCLFCWNMWTTTPHSTKQSNVPVTGRFGLTDSRLFRGIEKQCKLSPKPLFDDMFFKSNIYYILLWHLVNTYSSQTMGFRILKSFVEGCRSKAWYQQWCHLWSFSVATCWWVYCWHPIPSRRRNFYEGRESCWK